MPPSFVRPMPMQNLQRPSIEERRWTTVRCAWVGPTARRRKGRAPRKFPGVMCGHLRGSSARAHAHIPGMKTSVIELWQCGFGGQRYHYYGV